MPGQEPAAPGEEPGRAAESAARRDASSPGRSAARRILITAGDFLRRVIRKAEEDNIFFLAGAIAFNVVIAFVPLLIVVLGIAGTILRIQQTDPTSTLLEYIYRALPEVNPEFEQAIGDLLNDFVTQSTGLISVGTIVLLWVATRLVGTLRTVLNEIFDIHQARGFLAGKLFDLQMVIAAGTLFALSVSMTITAAVVARFGLDVLGIRATGIADPRVYGGVVAFLSIWAMFLLIYRYLPAHRIPWSTAIIAATVAAVLFELMKQGFGWYIANVADFTSIYGGYVATLIILVLWIYYSSVAFILAGQIAQVAALHRIRKRQRQRFAR